MLYTGVPLMVLRSVRIDGVGCAALGAIAALLTACTREPPRTALMFPVVRMLDAQPPALPDDVVWGGYARIAGEERLGVVTGFERRVPVATSPPMADSPPGQWSMQLPESLQQASWLFIQPGVRTPDEHLTTLAPRFFSPRTSGPVVLIDGGEAAALPDVQLLATVTPVPSLEARDVVGAPFLVPAGAVVSFAVGVHEDVWEADAAPVEFRVVAIEGARETIVHRAVLDPSRRPEDRRWLDARADLGAFGGRTIALGLRTTSADPGRAGTSLPLWADPVVLAPRPTHVPNVILISLDTLRAKSVSAYGSPRPTTPNLDRLIGDAGTVFDVAYTTAPHTFPAHLSAFTSLYSRALSGVTALSQLPADIPTLPEHLRAAGYETGAFTEDGFVVKTAGFRRGFNTYHENTSPNLHEPASQSAKTFRAAADWLATRRDHPTFLFVHTYEVHFPYTPAPPYDAAFTPDENAGDENALELLRYEQEARYLDDQLRAFLEGLDGLGLGTRTLVVVMADHGEEFLEHGGRRHGFQVYAEAVQVPLMLRLPGVVPAGLRVTTPVSLVDVAPTILDLVGAPPPIGIDGESLVPLLAGGALSGHRHAVFSESGSSLLRGVDTLSVRIPGLHCIYRTWQGTSQCFDTEADPTEQRPVLGDHPGISVARAEAVAYWSLRRTPPAPTAPAELVQALRKGADLELLEKLRSLGYVE